MNFICFCPNIYPVFTQEQNLSGHMRPESVLVLLKYFETDPEDRQDEKAGDDALMQEVVGVNVGLCARRHFTTEREKYFLLMLSL